MPQDFDWKTLLFTLDGRMRRTHFWVCAVGLTAVSLVTGWMPLVGLVVSLGLLLPGASIAVKRLHDMGRSGWIALVPLAAGMLINLAGAVVAAAPAMLGGASAMGILVMAGPLMLISGLVLLLNLAFLLWIGLSAGSAGPNRFGPDPREVQGA